MKANIKMALLGALVFLLLGGSALGQVDEFWTNNADLYYHASQNCGGAQQMVPISQLAAQAFAKYPCPICMEAADEDQQLCAVSRGGVIVIRCSDQWLSAQASGESVMSTAVKQNYTGQAAWQQLGEYLHGEVYTAFVEEYFAQGMAQTQVNVPHLFSREVQVMSSRHIAGDWYIVVRPEKKFQNCWELYWRVNRIQLCMDADRLSYEIVSQGREEEYALDLQRLDAEKALFTRSDEGFELYIYSALDGYVAVLRDSDGAAQLLDCARLMIEGSTKMIELSGYADGAAALYCCALTQGEVDALKANASLELTWFEPMAEGFYRVETSEGYEIYSEMEAQMVLAVEKLNGCDPVDAAFRIVQWSGGEARFVLWQQDEPVICDYSGQIYAVEGANGMDVGRLTPLCWKNGHGVFLAEVHKYKTYTPEERLFADVVEYGVRVGSEAEDKWGSYLCYLVDENGNALTGMENRAFTILEDGEILLEALNGDSQLYTPFSD